MATTTADIITRANCIARWEIELAAATARGDLAKVKRALIWLARHQARFEGEMKAVGLG